eukprot:323858-Rhodomonas_salina.1
MVVCSTGSMVLTQGYDATRRDIVSSISSAMNNNNFSLYPLSPQGLVPSYCFLLGIAVLCPPRLSSPGTAHPGRLRGLTDSFTQDPRRLSAAPLAAGNRDSGQEGSHSNTHNYRLASIYAGSASICGDFAGIYGGVDGGDTGIVTLLTAFASAEICMFHGGVQRQEAESASGR